MIRRFAIFSLGMACIIITACSPTTSTSSSRTVTTNDVPEVTDRGEWIFPPAKFIKDTAGRVQKNPIVVANSHITVIDKIEVPSQEDGTMAFIGTPLLANDKLRKGEQTWTHPRTKVVYRELRPGDRVAENQVIAILDDQRATIEQRIADAALKGAEAEVVAARKTVDSVVELFKINERGFQRGEVVPKQDYEASRANVARYQAELEAKLTAVKKAEFEVIRADYKQSKHKITAPTGGQITQIMKKPGEGIKALETVLQIQNLDRLRVEGSLDIGAEARVTKNMAVEIQPRLKIDPLISRTFHAASPITSIAVSENTENPLILSAGEDGWVYVWDKTKDSSEIAWQHKGPVRAVACTGKEAKEPLAITGCDDGYARIWKLRKRESEPFLQLEGRHEGGVRSVAFSPNGRWCATADGVRNIFLWDTTEGKQIGKLPQKHTNIVTALYFLPQCRLVSVGGDNIIHIWQVGDKGAVLERSITQRTGAVSQLGITEDGNKILVDRDKSRLYIVHLGDGQTEHVLENDSDTSQFRTFALFSPKFGAKEQRMILTASNTDGEVHVWRMPTAEERGSEFRQLNIPRSVPATAAAFSPKAEQGFVVIGTKQGEIHVWDIPSETVLNRRWIGRITYKEGALDTSARTIKIWAEFENDPDTSLPLGKQRLLPGTNAIMVIRPEQPGTND